MARTQYKQIKNMPVSFILTDEHGVDRGLYSAEQFGRNENGEYVCAGWGGSPTFLRVTKQKGNRLTCSTEDGTQQYIQIMVPVEQDATTGLWVAKAA